MRKFITLLFGVFVCHASLCQSTALNRYITKLATDSTLQNASWSIKVMKISTSETIIEYNSKLSLIPASLTKLITTGVANKILSDTFRFKTLLAYDGEIIDNTLKGDLYIIGGGDPFLGSYRYRQTVMDSVFSKWHSALVAKNITTIDGNIYYDASLFDDALIPDSWQWEDIGNYYGCGASALSFHENMYYICFKPSLQKGGETKIAYTRPSINSLTFDNKVTTGASGSGDNVTIYGAPDSKIHLLRGTVPHGESEFLVRGAMPNPPKTCADLFIKYMQQRRMNIPSMSLDISEKKDTSTENKITLFEYNSHTLSEIINHTNQQSNNMYAECIFKYLGSLKGEKGSYETGKKAVHSFLKSNFLNYKDINIVDGSGLSRQNLVTTDFLCSFLQLMKNNDKDTVYYNSLSKATQSSLIDNALTGTNAKTTLRYKTGSMKNVRSYAGYMKNANNEWICFSIIVNNFNSPDTEIRAKFEKIFHYMALSN